MKRLLVFSIVLCGMGNLFAQEAGKRMDANALRDHIRGLAKDDPDVRCFNGEDFDACHGIWKFSGFRNDKIRQRIHEIAMRNPQRAQLELLTSNAYYIMDSKIANESVAALQKIYRADALRTGNADDWLKSFRLRANDEDIKSYIEKASLSSVFAVLSEPAFHTAARRNYFQDLAQQRFLAANNPDGYYYAFRHRGKPEHLDKAVAMVQEKRSNVADEIVTALFERSFSSMDQVEQFSKIVERCQGCSSHLYTLVPKLQGFRSRFDVSEFLQSKEYRYHFSRVSYSVSQEMERGSYRLGVSSNATTATLVAKTDCKKGEKYTTHESLNFLEKIGAIFDNRPGEYISGKTVEMQKHSCQLAQGEADQLAKVAMRSSGDHTIQSNWDYESVVKSEYVWSPVPATTSSSAAGAGSANCYNIKNDALKAYCQRGESACSEFGYASNREKFGIPRWVEDFCRSNYSIGDKALDDYYRYGYTSQFKERKTYDSAQRHSSDQSLRKRWVINYANGYLMESY